LLLTSGMAPAEEKRHEGAEPIIPPSAHTSAKSEVIAVVDDPFVEEEKEPPTMIPGHELLGDTPVVFQPQNVMTMAKVGQPLSEVATQADVFIRYKCKKGECKTCAVNIDGKWVCACQTKIEPQAPGQQFKVRVRPVTEAQKREEEVAFFSPQSIQDGFFNNAWGMYGMVTEGLASDGDFEVRMARERRIQQLTAKKARHASKKLRGVRADSSTKRDGPAEQDGPREQDGVRKELIFPALFGVVGFVAAIMQPIAAS